MLNAFLHFGGLFACGHICFGQMQPIETLHITITSKQFRQLEVTIVWLFELKSLRFDGAVATFHILSLLCDEIVGAFPLKSFGNTAYTSRNSSSKTNACLPQVVRVVALNPDPGGGGRRGGLRPLLAGKRCRLLPSVVPTSVAVVEETTHCFFLVSQPCPRDPMCSLCMSAISPNAPPRQTFAISSRP